ncbi:hypothetical protein AAFF_G00042180 [Aldrovandia affinis]|uniref:Uncharacterized protein n=1 Tax=Aldrovandia affinis TaxID=143900 RepID=A0AAD7S2W0_9TELE|nr:hypothetical protein AAFF_G00042180 [Aldrovandia affinis]
MMMLFSLDIGCAVRGKPMNGPRPGQPSRCGQKQRSSLGDLAPRCPPSPCRVTGDPLLQSARHETALTAVPDLLRRAAETQHRAAFHSQPARNWVRAAVAR